MEYLIGVILALAIGFFATVVGFDRNRAFYPVVMIVIATYYALFALIASHAADLAKGSRLNLDGKLTGGTLSFSSSPALAIERIGWA